MTEHGEARYGTTVIPFEVLRSTRRKKTIEIRLDAAEGVRVAAPMRATLEQIQAVVSKRAPWIVRRFEDGCVRPKPRAFASGEALPYMGREVRMEVNRADVPGVRIRFRQWVFTVAVPAAMDSQEREAAIRSAFIRWYQRRAGERIAESVARWSPVVGVTPSAVKIRDQRRRWGSCAPNGILRFNWRIAMSEAWLLDYVVVHELCHLQQGNHSRHFWAHVEAAIPDFQLRRAQLKEIGPRLAL